MCTSSESQGSEGDSTMAAVSTLTTINKIIEVCKDENTIINQISHELAPVFQFAFGPKGVEFYEEAMQALTSILYFADGTLNHLLAYIPLLVQSQMDIGEVEGYAKEHMMDCISSFANFIFKYNDAFLTTILNEQGDTYFSMTLKLAHSFFQVNFKHDIIAACKLVQCILEGSRPKIDNYLQFIFNMLTAKFEQCNIPMAKIKILETLCMVFWYNIAVAASVIPTDKLTAVLTQIIGARQLFNDTLGRKRLVLSLGCFLLRSGDLPAEAKAMLP